MNRISTAYASTSSSTSYSSSLPSPFSRSNLDRDVLVQRTLLGENAYLDELETPSPIATPSPMIKQLSPLSQATHLNAAENPFLDSADYERDAVSDRWPSAISASAVAPLKQHTRQVQHHRSLPRSSHMTSSGPGLMSLEQSGQVSDAQIHTARQAPRSMESPSLHLPTIQEAAIRVSPPVPPRRRAKPNGMNSYPLPPATDVPRSSAQTPTWRRPSPFPLGPVPPPLPPRRIRTEPQPHIVDIAIEKFKINTHTLSYNPSPLTPTTPTSSKSAQQEERERQWEKWETERIRAQQMTMEAAKNNRVFAPRSNASSSAGSRTTTSTVASTSEKVKSAPTPVKKSKKRSWWCFGGGGVESDTEEEDEKSQYSREQQRRSVASLDAIDVDEEDYDGEEESSDARASSHGTGLLRFSCSKSSSSRKGATLKKKTQ